MTGAELGTDDLVEVVRRVEAAADTVTDHAATLLLNGLATAIDAHAAPPVAALVELGRSHGGHGTSAVPGRSERLDPMYAAAATAAASHAYDFDDTHLETVLHPTAAPMAAALALAAGRNASGAIAARAFVAGCEIELRVGAAMPGHYERGWHITGTCGVVGAAVAAGVVLGLDDPALANCLGIAASGTVGHRSAFGTEVKILHPAKAASNGVLAALLAERGMTSSPRAFDGPAGLFTAMAPRGWRRERITVAPGEHWELLATTVKPYPCGVVTHPAIEAAERLSAEIGDIDQTEGVEVRCHPLVPELTGVPEPADSLQARFSTGHAVAVALLTGALGPDAYAPARVDDPRVVRLRRLVRLVVDEACARDAATISLRMRDGQVMTARVDACRGSLRRPLTANEVEAKATRLVEAVLPGRGSAVIEATRALSAAPSTADLDDAVRPA